MKLVKGDSIFCATGITDSEFLNGITIDKINIYQKL